MTNEEVKEQTAQRRLEREETMNTLITLIQSKESAPSESLPEAVETAREFYGLTQGQWSKVLGMAETNYSAFKRGKQDLPSKAKSRAYILGVQPDVLFQASQCQPQPVSATFF